MVYYQNFIKMKQPKSLENKIRITFKNRQLLSNIFIHRSYLNENKKLKIQSNEKLEFLGDSVLSLITSIYLYKTYKDLGEGDYTDIKSAIVRTESLAKSARMLDLGSYLYLSWGEEKGVGQDNTNILADCFEALIGAIFLDQGFNRAYDFVNQYLFTNRLDYIIKNKLYFSPKSRLQETAQSKFHTLPVYQMIRQTGPNHKKLFTIKVLINSKSYATASGMSKKNAEENAAKITLDMLK